MCDRYKGALCDRIVCAYIFNVRKAGIEPQLGRSAIEELAQKSVKLQTLTELKQ